MCAKISLDVAEKLDITCRRGDTFDMQVTLKNSSGDGLALATGGYAFFMQVRKRNKTRDLIMGSTTTGEQATINFSFLNATDEGVIDIFCSDANMRSVEPGRYFYDLQYKVGETTKTFLKGSFILNDDVSKATS